MNIGSKFIEGCLVWAFYTIIITLISPSKRMAMALSLAVAILMLVTFCFIVAFSLIYRSLMRLKKRFPNPHSTLSNGDNGGRE